MRLQGSYRTVKVGSGFWEGEGGHAQHQSEHTEYTRLQSFFPSHRPVYRASNVSRAICICIGPWVAGAFQIICLPGWKGKGYSFLYYRFFITVPCGDFAFWPFRPRAHASVPGSGVVVLIIFCSFCAWRSLEPWLVLFSPPVIPDYERITTPIFLLDFYLSIIQQSTFCVPSLLWKYESRGT
jgi:hypothetical protein